MMLKLFYQNYQSHSMVVRIEENKFLGLTVKGPHVKTMEEWVSHLRTQIEEYSSSIYPDEEYSIENSLIMMGKILLRNRFQEHSMNHWGWYTTRDIILVNAFWTPHGIKVLFPFDYYFPRKLANPSCDIVPKIIMISAEEY